MHILVKYWIGKYMYFFYYLTIMRLSSCFLPFLPKTKRSLIALTSPIAFDKTEATIDF